MTEYTAVKEILSKTESLRENGTAVQKRWNGKIINTTQGVKGIVCGLQDATDYWVYWIDARMLAHCHTSVSQAGKCALRGNYPGDSSYRDISEELHQQFLKVVQKEKEPKIDLSVLDKNQLPGFIHCVVIEGWSENYEIRNELYINPRYVKEVTPLPNIKNGYNITYGTDYMNVIIPTHQFQN